MKLDRLSSRDLVACPDRTPSDRRHLRSRASRVVLGPLRALPDPSRPRRSRTPFAAAALFVLAAIPLAGYVATRDGVASGPSSTETAPAATALVATVPVATALLAIVPDAPTPAPAFAAMPAIEEAAPPMPPASTGVVEAAADAIADPLSLRAVPVGTDRPTEVVRADSAPARDPAPALAPPPPPIRHASLPALPRRDARHREAQDSVAKPRRLASAPRETPARRAPAEDATGTLARAAPLATRPFSLPDALRPSQ